MRVFGEESCSVIYLKNKNEYVRCAAVDLARDLSLVSELGEASIVDVEPIGEAIVIEENTRPDIDPIEDESFTIKCDGQRITISAPTYFGTMWGIYTFSEKVLGISPTFLWDGTSAPKVRLMPMS